MDGPYEWDNAKAELNRRKHGVGFEIVLEFGWEDAVLDVDERYAYGEERSRHSDVMRGGRSASSTHLGAADSAS